MEKTEDTVTSNTSHWLLIVWTVAAAGVSCLLSCFSTHGARE